MIQIIHRTREVKLYLNEAQKATLISWLGSCCFWFNQCLEKKIKTYKKTKTCVKLSEHSNFLTRLRKTDKRLRDCPVKFARDAARRVERGMQAFFRRLKAGQKPGFPRFKPVQRYNSMEYLAEYAYVRDAKVHIPGLGLVTCRGYAQDFSGKQKALRIIRRGEEWFAQILLEQELVVAKVKGPAIGLDLGLKHFAALSSGTTIKNPRLFRRSERKLRKLQRNFSRKQNSSANRAKARKKVTRHCARIAAQRRDFAHQESRKLVEKYATIVHEDLNIKGLARTKLSKSINDAGWGQFIRFIAYKAASAGKRAIAVDPRGTSQTCPSCGEIRKKVLSERMHRCSGCGLKMDRDRAAALVILERGRGAARTLTPVESDAPITPIVSAW